MKSTSQQTGNEVLSTVPLSPDDLLAMKTLFGYGTVQTPPASTRPVAVDPSSAYGCVDWYIYPDSKEVESVAA